VSAWHTTAISRSLIIAINLIIRCGAQEAMAMASAQDVATRDTAAPVPATDFEAETDVVVVGGGGGLPSALFSRWLGNEVILLEKAPELGGPSEACETMSDGGQVAVRTVGEAARRDGVDIRTGHRAQRLVVHDGAVVGVVASTPDGMSHRFRARQAVIFATGGFTHNPELRRNFLNVPVYGGCAATTNEGDLVAIASAVGAQLRNMNYAWMCPVPARAAHAEPVKAVVRAAR
jgi:succinate dehydrogenase/fumarate reductase flavoprotein subunit